MPQRGARGKTRRRSGAQGAPVLKLSRTA